MPRIKLTKSTIDAIPTPASDLVYWDAGCPGFGVKVTPKGRKVFVVLYRTGGAGSKLRKDSIGPYGGVTLHQARVAAPQGDAAPPRTSAKQGDGLWQTGWRTYWKASLPNMYPRPAPLARSRGFCAEKS